MAKINNQYRENAKERIIAAAIEVAEENGWDAVTLDAIAQKVGVTIPALYHYYKNREALFDEVILEIAHIAQICFETRIAHEDDIHLIIQDIADLNFNQKKHNGHIFIQLLAQMSQHPEQRKKIFKIFEKPRILLRDALIRAKSKGELPQQVDPDEVIQLVYAISLGLPLSSMMLGKEDTSEEKRIWINVMERSLLIPESINGKG